MKQNVKVVAGLAAVVVASGAWAVYDLQTKPANERIRAGIDKIVAQEPRVKPLYDQALADGVLTTPEADSIVKKAEEYKGK